MTQQLLTEPPEKSKQQIARREQSSDPARSAHDGSPSPILQLHRTLGNYRVAQLIQAKRLTPQGKILDLQSKLTVGAADDQYEQEADRVSRHVVSMPDFKTMAGLQPAPPTKEHAGHPHSLQSKPLPLAASITPFAQRAKHKVADKEEDQERDKREEGLQAKRVSDLLFSPLQRQEASEKNEDELVRAKHLGGSSTEALQLQSATEEENPDHIQAKSAASLAGSFDAGGEIESRLSQSKGGGSPLPDPVRAYMEPRFGVDFSHVRVHTDNDAVQMNRDVGAQAFTHGADIYYGAGSSPTNLDLTAHELTHVVQQTGGKPLRTKKQTQPVVLSPVPPVQRTCAACATGAAPCSTCAPDKPEVVQRRVGGGSAPTTPAHELTHTVQQGGSALHTKKQTGETEGEYLKADVPNIQRAWYNFDIPFTDYQFDPSLEGIKTAATVVKDTAVAAVEWIVDEIKSLVSSGIDWLSDKWNSIQEFASSAFKAAKNSFTNIIGFIKKPLGFLADALMSFDAQALAKGWATFSGLISTIANGFKAMTGNLLLQVNKIWGGINGFATSLLNRVSSLTENFVFKKLPDALQRIAFTIIVRLKSLWKSINDGWMRLFNKIKAWVDSALDTVFRFVRKVLSFGINVVVAGIIESGKIVLLLKDLFSNPQKYVALLAKRSVQAFDGVESRFAGVVGQYFGSAKTSAAPAVTTKIQRSPGPETPAETKRSASWGEIGHGIGEMMGKKWSEFKSNPMAIVTGLLMDMIFPIVGNIKDVIQLFKDIKKIVTGPLSAGSLEELWTSLLQILDIPILIYHTVVSILMRTLMLPLIVATFIPHPLVKGIAAAVGYGLLGAFVQAEGLNLAQKLLLLKAGVTTEAQKEEAYNRIADSLIALAMTAVIIVIMLILHFIANVMKGVYNFVKGKVFGIEPAPVEGKGTAPGEGKGEGAGEGRDVPESKTGDETLPDAESKKGVAAERSTADGHKIKVMDDGRIFICTTCEELRFKYRAEIDGNKDFQSKMADVEGTADAQAKADKIEALQKELAEARQKKLAEEPPEAKAKMLEEMRATARKIIGEIKARLKQREVINTLRETPEVKAEIEADLRKLETEMTRVEEGAKGVEGDPQLEDAAREEFDTVRAQGEALKEMIESELNPPEGSTVPRPTLKYPKSMLPTGGDHPYVSPEASGEVVQAAGEKSGYLDKDGNVWQVDRTKARTKKFFEWDVQTKDGGHINVGSDGTITH